MELPKHFSFNFEGILPDSKNIIRGNKYRFTVLSDLLIRIEYSENGSFEDRPTELVINRKFPEVNFDKQENAQALTIETSYFKLSYLKEMPFAGTKVSPEQNLKVELKNTDKFWYYGHPEVRNFGGTTYSLDGAEGKAKFGKGLYSTDGFVSIDDSKTLIFNQDGSLGMRRDNRIDIYLFMYKRDFGACLRDYFILTGYPPLIPRYILGNWWNRNIDYGQSDIEKLVYNFNKYNMPVSVLALSQKWHRDNGKVQSGFSFNEELIRKPKKFITNLHNKNIRVALAVNPVGGISVKEDYFIPYKNATGQSEEGSLPFNVFDKNILNAYLNYLIHPLMNQGVDFFWIDYKNEKDLATLRALTHYHFDDYKQLENRRGMVFARSGAIASHRYPVQYSGEMVVSWKNLDLLPSYNSTASNLGISWISNDIGGYTGGVEDGELFSRFVQFGCFSPILRLSSDFGEYYKREPWRWDISTQNICLKYLRLRHELIPYLYSEAYRYTKTGLPLIQPLYYRYPEIYDEPLYKSEYYFGSNLFVAPITRKQDPLMDRTVLKMFLPEGTWYDFTTGKKYKGGKRYTAFYKREDYPVFAKSGTIIPMAILDNKDINNTKAPSSMEIQIFPGTSSSYELYEDDGISSLYEQGYYIVTSIDYTYQANNFTVIIRPIAGKSGIIPKYRNYRIRFRNTRAADEVVCHIGEEKVKGVETYEDDNDFIVELPAMSTLKQLTVNCKGKNIEIDSQRLVNDDIDSILSDLPIKTTLKNELGAVVFSDKSVKDKRIGVRKLKKHGLSDKYVNLFLKLLEYLDEV